MGPLLQKVYRRLYTHYGPQRWWPGDGPFDVVVGAILTQAAAWSNVERGIASLKEAECWSWPAIYNIPVDHLAQIIRSCGYFKAKARKLKAFAQHVMENYDGDLASMLSQNLPELREELLSIHGIGRETADDILVYAAEKPSFVIDTYTRRILRRMDLIPLEGKVSYQACQSLFHENLPGDPGLFNEYHALLDQHAKEVCVKAPKCEGCCLKDICPTGTGRLAI
ncbi:MAG: hypothetical protein BZY75_00260 [SAR202 cluster bacterium Io17-Chloro-G7]|nr:MAG: hypothetical protein BZY75_00260 [SAR202 cluster bacterium Io17-Chloro-G7]